MPRIADAEGYPPRPPFFERTRTTLTTPGSLFTASMLRDIEGNDPIEADHIIGDLIRGASGHGESPDASVLQIAYTHLKAYEARRERTLASPCIPETRAC